MATFLRQAAAISTAELYIFQSMERQTWRSWGVGQMWPASKLDEHRHSAPEEIVGQWEVDARGGLSVGR